MKRGIAYIVAANSLAGTTYAATAQALQSFSPLPLVFWRTTTASCLLSPAIVGSGPYPKSHWLRMAFAGFFGYGLAIILATEGLRRCGPAVAGLLVGLNPLMLVLFSRLWLKEPMNLRKVTAVLVGIAGALALMKPKWTGASIILDAHALGVLLMIAHSAFASSLPIIGRTVLRQIPPLTYTGITTLLGLIPIAIFAWPQLSVSDPPWASSAWIFMLYLAVIGNVVCRFLGCKALQHLPASELAPYFFLQPLVGSILGAAWEERMLAGHELLGGALILLAAGWAMQGVAQEKTA